MNKSPLESREEILNFSLACKNPAFTDVQIDNLFMEFWLHETDEVVELANSLKLYRPNVYEKYNQVAQPKTKKKKS